MTLVKLNHGHWMPFRTNDMSTMPTQPACNLVEADDHFRIDMMVPGFGKKDIKVQVENMLLTISADLDLKSEPKEERIMRQEFAREGFSRVFRLSHWVDGENIAASYDQGILTVRIPKKEAAITKPGREIKIA